MTLLEKTIIDQARHELENLRRALLMPDGDDRISALSSSFWMLNGFTMLACLKDSGMSEDAATELHAIDREAGQATSAAGLVGVINKKTPR